MSEYWKSTPKYWCKHCTIYVKDTPFERKQHESTGKHQGNLKRFLRDIQNSHERGERDKERAKSEVERLSKVAGSDHGTQRQSGADPSTNPANATTVRKSTAAPMTVADQKRQWAQLADMGIAVPEQFRGEMAMAGDWNVVSRQVINEPPPEPSLSVGVKKRKFEGQEEEEEAGEVVARRGWGASTKRYPGQDTTDLDDLLAGAIPLKKEKPDPSSTDQVNKEKENNLKQESDPADDRNDADRLLRPPTKEEVFDEGAWKVEGSVLKVETDDHGRAPTAMDKIPEETPTPVFKKKRKAKAS
ncbi:hypothetical protein LTR10_016584 [Elasticomyces elasticus]|uniref:U1-type domain-containing protein n=1 Tax=Exophiala sideris TaxID=1016849 RepID=A0ABR0JJI8_9EURO|nr:hypothetical protein LTR10_016584 [Elasticomyces elasticus]KAK5035229.1 hypothetical protein LTS07_002665 [Exophiala sideris]KAK5039419.1 hypothetical protein LTR13_003676 [Exophiala sideris]KAK5066153.1 hypothetical protein LTR69_002671 [Exophiala sideris]KAK5186830.1 hypothetical protein LTR44_000836 [Eurotiomycetes sp. CCFEE 6388]